MAKQHRANNVGHFEKVTSPPWVSVLSFVTEWSLAVIHIWWHSLWGGRGYALIGRALALTLVIFIFVLALLCSCLNLLSVTWLFGGVIWEVSWSQRFPFLPCVLMRLDIISFVHISVLYRVSSDIMKIWLLLFLNLICLLYSKVMCYKAYKLWPHTYATGACGRKPGLWPKEEWYLKPQISKHAYLFGWQKFLARFLLLKGLCLATCRKNIPY